MDQSKIDKLPALARDYIKRLKESNIRLSEEPRLLQRRIEHLEKIERKQRERIGAMVLMFQCAARGGNEIASAVQGIVEDFLTEEPQ